jgi:LAO/AO transport system kinase
MDLARHEGWEVPIIKTVSSKGEGITKLLEAIDNHRTYLQASGRLEDMRRKRARRQLLAAAQAELLSNLLVSAESNGRLDKLIEAIAERELDPHTAADQLIANTNT